MSKRVDFLGTECDLGGLSIQDFQDTFCARCTQPECTRSLDGSSRFDQRVRNWEKRLFKEVPRLDPSDPRFQQIASKKFLTLDAGPVPQIRTGAASAWMDPRDVQEPAPAPMIVPATPAAPELPAVVSAPAPAPPVRRAQPMNTPNQGGIMIGNAPAPPPAKDPWAGPVPAPKPTETVIKPGTKIKVGV